MADIHLYTPEGETTVQPEEHVVELVRVGAIAPGTFFWREGMSDWQPIASFQPTDTSAARPATTPLPKTRSLLEPDSGPPDLAPEGSTRLLPEVGPHPAATPASEKHGHTVGRNRFRFRRKPEPLTTIVQVLLVLCICVTVLELVAGIVRYSSLSAGIPKFGTDHGLLSGTGHDDLLGGGELSSVATDGNHAFTPDDGDDAGRLLEWLGWAVNVVFIVPYFMWLYRTVQNCRNFSFIMRFSPEWAVWCYFIPPVFFFRPLQVMQEVWKVSRNPRTWHNDRPSIFVGLWWLLTLATGALALSSWLHSLSAETRAQQMNSQLLFLALKVVQVAWYAIFLTLVTQVIQMQTHVVRAARRKAERGEPEEE